ncbi:MAG: GTP-binding protein [Planctomycetes bacterium]|nr:GTP-binding protein [Planctomycetota bacterium]
MYELRDTIVAVSSPSCNKRVIIRITGPNTVETCKQIFISPIINNKSGIVCGSIEVDDELSIEAKLYLFFAPHSYTGEDIAEIHIDTSAAVTEVLIDGLLGRGLRMAGPGEFTARAYLNGKIDLAQAEAVNEIIVSSNSFQLAAAEKLLSGKLSQTSEKVHSAIVDCLSLIEAGLDFSSEDIEPESGIEIIEKLLGINGQLEELLSGSIRYETMIDLPAVGIAGAPNAGKSSLLNKLLGKERSIVSHRRKTTRDVLSAPYSLAHCRCVLFDCAGLIIQPEDILDELAQNAAVEAMLNSALVVFCIDISKADFSEDISIREYIKPQILIPVATKCDLLSEEVLSKRLGEVNELFCVKLLAISSKSGAGLEVLREKIDEKLIELEPGFSASKTSDAPLSESVQSSVALTARHKQAVTEAIENVGESIVELKADNSEIAAMMLRTAYQAVSNIGSAGGGHIDEQILEQIFSRFCIGK